MPSPLRIAFIGQKGFPASWGGVEAHVEALAVRLAARGHHPIAYVRRWYSTGSLEPFQGVERVAQPSMRSKHLDAATHSFCSAVDAMTRDVDIVHFHAVGPALFSGLPRLAGRRVVTTIHSLDYLNVKWGTIARGALRMGEQLAFLNSHRVVVVAKHLARLYQARGLQAEYVPNGVDVPPPVPPGAWLASLGLNGSDYLLSIGRWTGSKRVRESIEVFLRVRPPGLKFVVAGEADDPAYAAAVRAATAGSPDVILPGYVTGTKKLELLSNAAAFVTFSEHEGLPIALLEAMGHGRTCLASDIVPHAEVMEPGGGLLRPAASPVEREHALRELCALDAGTRSTLGDAARQHVAEYYTWDRTVEQLEHIYIELAGDRRRGRPAPTQPTQAPR
jgi:glycosyltransferase involved in cell wall biosynthesis